MNISDCYHHEYASDSTPKDSSSVSTLNHQKSSSYSIKPKISFQETWRCYNKPDMISLSKQKPKVLEKITISPILSNRMDHNKILRLCQTLKSTKYSWSLELKLSKCNQEALEQIALQLKSLNRVHSLKLDFSECNRVFPNELMTLFSSLKTSHNLTNFYIDFSKSKLSFQLITDLVSKALKRQRTLQNLKIGLRAISDVVFQDMDRMIKSLKKCSKLQSLSLDFSKCHNTSTQVLHNLLLHLKCFKSLTRFDLNLSGCQAFNALGIGIIGVVSSYPVNKKIQSLSLNLKSYSCVNIDDFEALIGQLKEYTALEILEISFPPYAQDMLSVFTSNIKELNCLRVLKMNLRFLKDLTLQEFTDFASAIKDLQSVKVLDLSLNRCGLRPKEVEIILEGIRGLKNLKCLNLSLNKNYDLDDKTAENIGSCLQELKELKSLDLGFVEYCITKTGIKKIIEGLKENKKLKSVKLRLGYPGRVYSNSTFLVNLFQRRRGIMLSSELENSFTRIQNLDLNLTGFKLNGLELHSMSLNLRRMKAIRQIALAFDCQKSSVSWRLGFGSLIMGLKENIRLDKLSINLENSYNEDLEALFENLKGLKRIKSLNLMFERGLARNVEGTMKFWEAMKDLNELEELRLCFSWFASFKAEAIRYLLLGLGELKCVRNLVFDLMMSVDYLAVQGYVEVEEVEREILKKLKNLRTLTYFTYMDERMIY